MIGMKATGLILEPAASAVPRAVALLAVGVLVTAGLLPSFHATASHACADETHEGPPSCPICLHLHHDLSAVELAPAIDLPPVIATDVTAASPTRQPRAVVATATARAPPPLI
jgi:hypothetical protein